MRASKLMQQKTTSGGVADISYQGARWKGRWEDVRGSLSLI